MDKQCNPHNMSTFSSTVHTKKCKMIDEERRHICYFIIVNLTFEILE